MSIGYAVETFRSNKTAKWAGSHHMAIDCKTLLQDNVLIVLMIRIARRPSQVITSYQSSERKREEEIIIFNNNLLLLTDRDQQSLYHLLIHIVA